MPALSATLSRMAEIDANAVMSLVGRRISSLRRARGQTQESLAMDAKVSVKYLQRVEAGNENLTIRSLVRFGSLLGVSVVELLAVEDSELIDT